MTRKRSTRKNKHYTLSEFKAWLEGIEELQESSWAPSASQWKTIRDKLFNIVEEAYEPESVHKTDFHIPPLQQNLPPRMPTVPSSIPIPQQSSLTVSPSAQQVLDGKLPVELIQTPDGKTKTPDLDTSDGSYGSSFA